MTNGARTLKWVIDTLRRFYGAPPKAVSSDPFRLVLYEQVGYLVPDEQRRAAYRRLQREVGLTPAAILDADDETLQAITRSGGSIAAEVRAARIRASAQLVVIRWKSNLRQALRLPLEQARAALARFPMIGRPGADQILATSGAHPVLGLDSNGMRVALRLGWGKERGPYAATYRSVQDALLSELPRSTAALAATASLLRQHGKVLCRGS